MSYPYRLMFDAEDPSDQEDYRRSLERLTAESEHREVIPLLNMWEMDEEPFPRQKLSTSTPAWAHSSQNSSKVYDATCDSIIFSGVNVGMPLFPV